jgi:branched-chain amino acid transport system permease protein
MVALAGGVLLGVVEAMVSGYGNAAYQTLVALVVMLTVMIWQAARRPTMHQEASV